jgi:hypothetical protein
LFTAKCEINRFLIAILGINEFLDILDNLYRRIVVEVKLNSGTMPFSAQKEIVQIPLATRPITSYSGFLTCASASAVYRDVAV